MTVYAKHSRKVLERRKCYTRVFSVERKLDIDRERFRCDSRCSINI